MKLYIIGTVGSGKTTLAKELSAKYNIPWYELDLVVYVKTDTERYKCTPEEQVAEIERIDSEGDWIMEGVVRKSQKCLFDLADEVIFLDTPAYVRNFRIFKRFVRQQLRIEYCEYKSDLTMLKMMYKWSRGFEKDREQFLAKLQPYTEKLKIIKHKTEMP